jgi:VanZ like family
LTSRRRISRHFPPPWRAEKIHGGYVVRDANDQALAYGGAVVAIGALSLVPIEWRPHIGAPGQIEHLAAYVVAATVVSLSYPRRSLIIIVALFFYAACLEIAQLYAPGRHPAVSDWIAGSFGALIGVVIGTFILRLRPLDAIEKKAGADFLGP